MKEIGGFFGLELRRGKEFHERAIKLNSGRNALWYILKAKRPKKVFLPYYICDAVLEPFEKENVTFEFYRLNEGLEPILHKEEDEPGKFILYVNYFGVCDGVVKMLSEDEKHLIIDNSQAFFSRPLEGTSTFYSPRKFFGVPDGGYLYTDSLLDEKLGRDVSYERSAHLLKRIDLSAKNGYPVYQENEKAFSGRPIKRMSRLTEGILSSIDYGRVREKREENFRFLHKQLGGLNELRLPEDISGPMVYPFLIEREGLKDHLINESIFVATYWKDAMARAGEKNLEYKLAKYLVPLPVDQRYGLREMKEVVGKVAGFLRARN